MASLAAIYCAQSPPERTVVGQPGKAFPHSPPFFLCCWEPDDVAAKLQEGLQDLPGGPKHSGPGYGENPADNTVGGPTSQPEYENEHLNGLALAMVSILVQHPQEGIQRIPAEAKIRSGVTFGVKKALEHWHSCVDSAI